VHALRAAVDAIAVGIGTVLADDPRLTVRGVVRRRPFVRVVFDRGLRLPLTSRLLTTLDDGPIVVLTAPGSLTRHAAAARALVGRGVVVTEAADLESGCRALLPWDVHTLLVEGGAVLHRALLAADLVDRVHLVVSPRALGPAGVPLFDGHAIPWTRMIGLRAEPCGPDVWMEADVHGHR
jgi:diaminohydroxyphosphoribosylaminopyrimidine deaminase/5-amino-6-(5-phosphoribosylamino)uracil reductase